MISSFYCIICSATHGVSSSTTLAGSISINFLEFFTNESLLLCQNGDNLIRFNLAGQTMNK